ncbi:MAG TPA: CDP-glycerol glycerophosphotransferase family protein [Salinimicrobium sp.]|nr:CDP-glycerol glycerophosphotransferase family protein [Salinimicrobium sp.]
MEVLKNKNHTYLWFLTENIASKFPFKTEPHTSSIKELKNYNSDAILCPGNEVPHFLRGVKVQIFHGLAGEKKGHFRIRHYFDLYLTQGPYFTKRFLELKQKYKDFEVIETGWPKLDVYAKRHSQSQEKKEKLLQNSRASKLILYAPTFSPSLTSAPYLIEEIKNLAQNKEFLVLIKFHDLMDQKIVEEYENLAAKTENIIIEKNPNIIPLLQMADLMISDTSSVVYEFLLLNKPVITFKSNSEKILWDNSAIYKDLEEKVEQNLKTDPFKQERLQIIENYHPYQDGKSALRMTNAIENYIEKNGVPEKRKLPFLRRLKINKKFKKL